MKVSPTKDVVPVAGVVHTQAEPFHSAMSLVRHEPKPECPNDNMYLMPVVGDPGAEEVAKVNTGFCHNTPEAKALSTYPLLTASPAPTGNARLVILFELRLTLVLNVVAALTVSESAEESPIVVLPKVLKPFAPTMS